MGFFTYCNFVFKLFQKISNSADLNYIIIFEKRVTDLLKKLKKNNTISEEAFNKLRPVGLKPGTFYGSAKVHKPLINGLLPFRPILSATGTPTLQTSTFFSSRSV